MPCILLDNASVEFPIYSIENRSLRNAIFNGATGGNLNSVGSKLNVVALNKINLEVNDGDRIGLVGNNGAGKSTLLRVIAGIYTPTSGTVNVEGTIGSMLSITLGMDMEATGYENIFLRGAVMGIRPSTMQDYLQEISDFSGLGDYLELPIRTYSTGMLMRLAFAVSTCINHEIVLMDEWLSVGDADFVEKAKIRLKDVVEKSNILILASHNLGLIKEQCNKIYKLEKGVLTNFFTD